MLDFGLQDQVRVRIKMSQVGYVSTKASKIQKAHIFHNHLPPRLHLICNSVGILNYVISSFFEIPIQKSIIPPTLLQIILESKEGIFQRKGTFRSMECFKRLWRKNDLSLKTFLVHCKSLFKLIYSALTSLEEF